MNIWEDIRNYEGYYQINEFGQIRRIKQKSGTQAGRILKDFDNGNGYRFITLRKNNVPKNFYIHIILAECFIPNHNNKPQVNHKNGIKSDNRLQNLEWCTLSENMIHATQSNLLKNKGEDNIHCKITEKDVLEMRRMDLLGVGRQQLSFAYGISSANVHRIIHRQIWKHI